MLIVLNVLLALLIGNQYGQTWDEPSFYLYGERSYEAFTLGLAGKPLIPERHIFFLDLRYYGPVYVAIGWKIVELLTPVLKGWGNMDVWHLLNFTFFQASLIALYLLAKRFVKPWTAFFITLLFGTQPLIFGHAFINPKDIPFMTLFLASVTTGIAMTDAIKKDNVSAHASSPKSPPSFPLVIAILLGLFAFTYIGKDLIHAVVESAITSMYNAPANSPAGKVFSLLVGNENRLPVENYVHKASAAHLERLVLYFLFFSIMGRELYLNHARPSRLTLPFEPNLRLWGLVLTAGVMLGLATSIRLLAPFAGLLIAGYAIEVKGRDSLPPLIVYASIAGIVSMLTWPFLWDSPSFHFAEALQVMRDFPFNAELRFMGDNIAPSNLPWYFIPFLLSVQLTEPAVLLAWIGLIAVLTTYRNSNLIGNSLLLAWLIVPVGLQILLKSNVYDNFRQFLFVLPPVFVLGGMGLELLITRLSSPAARFLLTGACVAPGLIGIVLLHPVQYIYYNSFVGGVRGAEGDFELDYWLTSYREAASYINENAPLNANILAWGSGFNGAREDLDIYSFGSEDDLRESGLAFEYAVISTRFSSHLGSFKDAPVVYEVRINGALLAVVKKLAK
ncbi:MAG: hypothetical protein HND47_20855 [Chloroflexi bacterium]|nr:hypothetical protein [Chloroflexota bacterium]